MFGIVFIVFVILFVIYKYFQNKNKKFKFNGSKTKPTKKKFSSIAFVVNPNAGKGGCGKIFDSQIQPLLNQWENMKIMIEKTKGKNEANLIAKNFSNKGFEAIIR